MHQRCCRLITWIRLPTAASSVELIGVINKKIIVAFSWLLILCYQWCTVTQASNAQTIFDIRLTPIFLIFPASFFSDNLTFVPIYSCRVVQILNKIHEQEFLWFGKKYEAASRKPPSAMYNFTVTCNSHINWIYGFILCTLYSSDHCAFCSLK